MQKDTDSGSTAQYDALGRQSCSNKVGSSELSNIKLMVRDHLGALRPGSEKP